MATVSAPGAPEALTRPTGQRHGRRAAHRRIAGLDGLRGAAVVAVVVFHAWPAALSGGFIGVDVFFVLSGFLITRELLRGGGLVAFWRRRALRILPPMLLMVALVSGVVLLVGGDAAAVLRPQLIGAGTFSSNWIAIAGAQDYFDDSAPQVLTHLWSLAVEEQFYLVWPFLLLLLLRLPSVRRRVAVVLLAAAASATAMAVLVQPAGVSRVYFGTDTHAFGLLLGAAVALAGAPARRTAGTAVTAVLLAVAGLSGLCWAALRLSGPAPSTYTGPLPLVAVAAAAVVLGLVRGPRRAGRVLDAPLLGAAGRRSYGLYLWHRPLLTLAAVALPPGVDPAVRTVAALLVTVLAAELSYRLVERPARRAGVAGVAGVRRPLVRPAVAVPVVALVLAVVVTPSPSTAAERDVARGAAAIAAHGRAPVRPVADRPTVSAPVPTRPAAVPTPTRAAAGPRVSAPLPRGFTAVGDSVMLAAAPELLARFPGADIDARVGRQAWTAPDVLSRLRAAGRLQRTVVLGLGTNGALGAGTLDRVRAAIGDRDLVLVDVHADRPWAPGVDAALHGYAARHARTAIACWDRDIAAHQDLLAPDGIHPGARGGRIYAHAVVRALRALRSPAPAPSCGAAADGAVQR